MSATAKGTTAGEVHDLDPADFLEEVHSFEFWFQAIEGYLSGTTHGHRPETAEEALTEEDRQGLISLLCNYCVAESAALDTASGLVTIAPNRHSKIFLSTQVVDEGRHLEVFLHRLHELGIVDAEAEIEKRASPSILALKSRLLQLIEGKDWDSAIFAQNVALESLEFVVFRRHCEDADPVTAEILASVVKDERRHMGFGENELGRRFRIDPTGRVRIREFRKEIDHLIHATLKDTVQHLGLPASDQDELGRLYRESVERLGLS